jgi:hypothetical protein
MGKNLVSITIDLFNSAACIVIVIVFLDNMRSKQPRAKTIQQVASETC